MLPNKIGLKQTAYYLSQTQISDGRRKEIEIGGLCIVRDQREKAQTFSKKKGKAQTGPRCRSNGTFRIRRPVISRGTKASRIRSPPAAKDPAATIPASIQSYQNPPPEKKITRHRSYKTLRLHLRLAQLHFEF
jgi:hypothetical protein